MFLFSIGGLGRRSEDQRITPFKPDPLRTDTFRWNRAGVAWCAPKAGNFNDLAARMCAVGKDLKPPAGPICGGKHTPPQHGLVAYPDRRQVARLTFPLWRVLRTSWVRRLHVAEVPGADFKQWQFAIGIRG